MNLGDLTKLIDREHLHRVVVNITGRTDAQVLGDLQVERATGGVEGFLSIVLRVKVSFASKDDPLVRSKSLFVKCLPRDKFQLGMVKVSNAFGRERVYYGQVVPLLKQVAAGKLDVPLPQCYLAYNDVIYFEDLAETGFITAGHQCISNGLDLEHSTVLVRNLAVLHALTVAAERLLPPGKRTWEEAFPALGKEPMYYVPNAGDPPVPFKGVADAGSEIVVEVAGRMSGLPKLAAESGKLRCIIQGFWPIICELVKPNPKGRNVLCHRDCWVNNFMFQYRIDDEGVKSPVSMKFVDLQMAKYCHPSIDFLYFMYHSLSKALRDEYYDRFVDEYYNSFQESLEMLGFGPPPFSREEFVSDLKLYKPFGVYFGAVYTPCMLLGDDYIPKNVEEMTPEILQEAVTSGNVSAIRKRLVSDPSYRSEVEVVVREFVDFVFPDGSLESSPFLK